MPTPTASCILVTGGARSGKSGYAQALAEARPGRRVFIATCPAVDPEMDARIARHRQDREGRGWETVEEALDLAAALRSAAGAESVLVDCLTLWVNNLMWEAEQAGRHLDEDALAPLCESVLAAARAQAGTVVFVTNEVGWGIVPENAVARRFRDLAGRCNRHIAAGCDQVVLMVSGQPLVVRAAL